MLSIPMVLEMLMESLFAIVDIYWVAKISVNAIATVTLTETVIFVIFALSVGLSMAATALVARRVGEKNFRGASKYAAQVMILALFISLIFALVGVFFAPDILHVMGGEPEIVQSGQGYTRILLGGNTTIVFLFLINAIFRGAGDASIAMRALWFANIINIILDPLLIFGWGPIPAFGIEGAAIATTTGRGLGVLYQLSALYSKKSRIDIRMNYFIPDMKKIVQIIKISLGGIGQHLIGTLSWMFMVRISAEFGSAVLAGYSLAIRTIMFTILPSWGFSNAAATLVGQNLGAGKPERAEKSVLQCAKYNVIFLSFVAVGFIFFSDRIIQFFTVDLSVIEYGAIALKYIGFGYVFYAYAMVVSQAFNGAGDTRTPTIINLICFWLFEIPLAYLLAITLGIGPKGIFIAISSAILLMTVIFYFLFKQGKWKEVKV